MRAQRDVNHAQRLAREATLQELRRQGKSSIAEVPMEARQAIVDTLSAQMQGASSAGVREALLELWTAPHAGLDDARRAQLGLETHRPVTSSWAQGLPSAGRLSPLAAVRFANAVPDPSASQPAESLGESKPATGSPTKSWDEEKRVRSAQYWLRRMTGRLPELQRGEAVLRDTDATVIRKRRLGGGINGSFILEMSNGAKGVWKPSASEYMKQLRDCVEEDHQARREAAAYIVDSWMGHLAKVPPTVYREVEGQAGAFMEFVDGKPPDLYSPKRDASVPLRSAGPQFDDYRRVAIFDHVIGNLDRHSANWMVQKEGELIPIDHGLAFPLKNGTPGAHKFYFNKPLQLRPEEREALQNLVQNRRSAELELAPLLAPEAIASMFERVETMLQKGTTDNGWRGGGSELEQRALEGVMPAP